MSTTIPIKLDGRGFEFRIGNRPYLLSSVHSYRGRYGDDLEGVDNYPYVIAEATVIADDGGRTARELRARPTLDWYTVFDIEGLGKYIIVPPKSYFLDGDYPPLLPLEGQAGAEQAEKRAISTATKRKGFEVKRVRPYPVYDSS